MRNEKEILIALTEKQLSSDEALLWVLNMKKGKRYNYGQNKDKSSGFSIEKGL